MNIKPKMVKRFIFGVTNFFLGNSLTSINEYWGK